MLLIICGPPCTGKSTIGAELQRRFGFVHLEMDAIRQRILPESDQRQEHRDVGYRAMHLVAEHLCYAGKKVAVNATYNRELHRNELATMLESISCSTILVQCMAPLETVMARFTSRPSGHAALDLTEDLVRELWSNFAYSRDGIVVDTSKSVAVCLDEIETHLNRRVADSIERWKRME